ncbi:MAG TPA: hypothetical protein VGO58_19420 [Chitinophagaceae bacterium]|nr:hypothetical protein [Chitinophagaceae bacterium]
MPYQEMECQVKDQEREISHVTIHQHAAHENGISAKLHLEKNKQQVSD